MPTPGTFPSTTAISFSQVNTEFGLTTPSPMDLKYRFTTPQYTPTTPAIPTVSGATFPVDSLHGRTKVPSFITTFTTPGSWTATLTGNIKVLVVGGGGGGGGITAVVGGNGGGGGGGVIYTASFPVINGTVYPYTVGATVAQNLQGNPSTFSTISAGGGGAGARVGIPSSLPLRPGLAPGGAGGGGCTNGTTLTPNIVGGTGSAPGQPGGAGWPPAGDTRHVGAGGGGAGTAGTAVSPLYAPGPGGNGLAFSITGSSVYYGGGGGGGAQPVANPSPTPISGGTGGLGGGGAGAVNPPVGGSNSATPGTNGLGGGGGGANGSTGIGGNGGSGIVIIAYP